MNSVKQLRSYFVQNMIKKGNLFKADSLFKSALKYIYLSTKDSGLKCAESAINNTRLFFSLKRYYRGGSSYFVPVVVVVNNLENKKAVKSILKVSEKRNQSLLIGLASELYLASKFKGEAIKFKNDFNFKVIKGIPYTRFLKKFS